MAHHQPRRGVQDIRTLAGRSTAPGSAHKNYMRLCTLEMERQRRSQEFEVAQARADAARRRVQNLEAEIVEVLRTIGAPQADLARAVRGDDEPVLRHAYGTRSNRKKETRS